MNKVWFRNHENQMLFVLNSCRQIETVPIVGDIIKTCKDDFQKATYRMNPDKAGIWLDFIVISRSYSTCFNEWELICEPTPKTLMYLLEKVKTA